MDPTVSNINSKKKLAQRELDEDDDSFTKEVGDMSISSRKKIFMPDDQHSNQGISENSESRETEVVLAKANLITKFESEPNISLKRKDSKRYEEYTELMESD